MRAFEAADELHQHILLRLQPARGTGGVLAQVLDRFACVLDQRPRLLHQTPDIRSPWTKPLLPIPDAVATDAVFRPAHRASTCLLRSKERTKKLSTVVHSNECPESPALDSRRHHLGRHARARARILIRGTRDQR